MNLRGLGRTVYGHTKQSDLNGGPSQHNTPDRWSWRDGFIWRNSRQSTWLATLRAFFAFGALVMVRRFDDRSDEAKQYRRHYNTRRWRARRRRHLEGEPLCRMCMARGVLNDGSRRMDGSPQPDPKRRFLVADHIKEHKGNTKLFWEGELQTLCPDHHDTVKQAEEHRGFSTEVDLDGWPIDPRHPAAR